MQLEYPLAVAKFSIAFQRTATFRVERRYSQQLDHVLLCACATLPVRNSCLNTLALKSGPSLSNAMPSRAQRAATYMISTTTAISIRGPAFALHNQQTSFTLATDMIATLLLHHSDCLSLCLSPPRALAPHPLPRIRRLSSRALPLSQRPIIPRGVFPPRTSQLRAYPGAVSSTHCYAQLPLLVPCTRRTSVEMSL